MKYKQKYTYEECIDALIELQMEANKQEEERGDFELVDDRIWREMREFESKLSKFIEDEENRDTWSWELATLETAEDFKNWKKGMLEVYDDLMAKKAIEKAKQLKADDEELKKLGYSMVKKELAEKIESHHLYTGKYDSKRYYKYNSKEEVQDLMERPLSELIDIYEEIYDAKGRERTMSEIF